MIRTNLTLKDWVCIRRREHKSPLLFSSVRAKGLNWKMLSFWPSDFLTFEQSKLSFTFKILLLSNIDFQGIVYPPKTLKPLIYALSKITKIDYPLTPPKPLKPIIVPPPSQNKKSGQPC